MTMIERVARAICRRQWPDETRYKVYLPAAKAAIEAMREPTEEMIKSTSFLHQQIGLNNINVAKAFYVHMIDAALKE